MSHYLSDGYGLACAAACYCQSWPSIKGCCRLAVIDQGGDSDRKCAAGEPLAAEGLGENG